MDSAEDLHDIVAEFAEEPAPNGEKVKMFPFSIRKIELIGEPGRNRTSP